MYGRIKLAEREGFEPSIQFPVYTLSKRAPSTTRPSLRRHLGTPSGYHGGSGQIELLLVQRGVAGDQNRAPEDSFNLLERGIVAGFESHRHLRIHPKHNLFPFHDFRKLLRLE